MFDVVYRYRGTAARHEAAPLREERVRYLAHCHEQGATRGTLKQIAWMMLVVIEELDLKQEGQISRKKIVAAADRWANREPRHHNIKHARKARAHFISVATQWLRFLGWLCVRKIERPHAHMVQEFAEYMIQERGLSRHTLRVQCWFVNDYAVILFLYNAGARADEAAQLRISHLDLSQTPERYQSSVEIHGKGNKLRRCPLWPQTVSELTPLVEGRSPSERVFLNRCGRPVTRFGIHTRIERHAKKISERIPSLTTKRVSPDTIRHTTATHLLRAGVDINTIRAWLGHVSLNTTNIYAEVDLEMKVKALATCEVAAAKPTKRWREDAGLMSFLRTL